MKTQIAVIIDCWPGHIGTLDLRSQMCRNVVANLRKIQPDLVVISTDDTPDFKGGIQGTHPIIRSADFACQTVYARELHELEQSLDHREWHLERVWVFGCHWNMCVAIQPLGYRTMRRWARRRWPDVDIMFRDDCLLALPLRREIFPDDQEFWPDLSQNHHLTPCKPVAGPDNHVWRLSVKRYDDHAWLKSKKRGLTHLPAEL